MLTSIEDYVQRNYNFCLFCKHPNSKPIAGGYYDGQMFQCPVCGEYEISRSLLQTSFQKEVVENFFKKAPAIAAERHLHGHDRFSLYSYDFVEFLNGYPTNFIEKLERALANLAILTNYEPNQKEITVQDFGILFIEHNVHTFGTAEITSMLNQLQNEGWITFNSANGRYSYTLTLNGIKQALKLKRNVQRKHQTFIAMWFDNTTSTFRKATKDAIAAAGYKPEIVDENYHNDFIMNKVINMINDSRFVIADLTSIPEEKDKSSGVRGGVYFEAGYAEGRGLPVILTCEKNAHDRVHFDLKQKSTILWTKDESGILKVGQFNYVEYLIEHIIATIGKGPLFDEKVLVEIKSKYK